MTRRARADRVRVRTRRISRRLGERFGAIGATVAVVAVPSASPAAPAFPAAHAFPGAAAFPVEHALPAARAIQARQAAKPDADGQTLSFVVLGHLRGNASGPHYLLDEIMAEVAALQPDVVFLTGDIIWGDIDTNPADSTRVVREWEVVDSALATLGVPVYRAPGNHDINDLVTRDIFFERYGRLPKVVDVKGSRFILLASGWIPENGDTGKHRHIRGVPLDSSQVRFLRDALADTSAYEHAFVLMHHLLWWEADAEWWTTVHPLLVESGVRAVFSGDYGPMKFSSTSRDGVDYYQSSLEGDVSVRMLRAREASRLLAQQFDNFLYVRVDGPRVSVDVRTLGELSSGRYTPERWRAVHQAQALNGLAAPGRGLAGRLWRAIGTPGRLLGLGLFAGICFLLGFVAARLLGTRPR